MLRTLVSAVTVSQRAACAVRSMASIPAFPYTPKPYNGPDRDAIMQMRKDYAHPSQFLFYKDPIAIVEGKMQYLFDEKGRRYLDMFAGIVTVSVGHCHPEVTKALKEQVDRVWHTTTIYLNDTNVQYNKELRERLPPHLDTIFVVNSGSEANDLALAMARVHTGNTTAVALRNGYHGLATGSMALTSLRTWKQNMMLTPGVVHTMNPDPYRGVFGNDVDAYVNELRQTINFDTAGTVCGMWAEPIQGVGGAAELLPGYMPKAAQVIREAGGLVIIDEVQTGFGRTGDHYWGFQMLGVEPDMVVMAKGIGNGFPMACVATRRSIAESFTKRVFFNTYGGNPLSSAVGRSVLRVIDKEGLQNNCKTLGGFLKEGMNKLAAKHSIIGNVRGQGLMLGLELVKDRKTKEPAAAETAQVMETMKNNQVLVGKGGFYGNVLRIKPPMCITKDDAQFFLDVLDDALKAL